MTRKQADAVSINKFLSRKKEGSSYQEVVKVFGSTKVTDLKLHILDELRSGRIKLYAGKLYSKTQYERAVKD